MPAALENILSTSPTALLVFTLPQPIAALALQNPRVVYTLLFRAASRTLRTLASDPKHLGAEIGFFAVLHTWGQALQLHPHLHCVVPGGGIAPDGDRWIACRPGFFLPVRVLSRLFRRLFLELLQQAFLAGRLQFRHALAALNHPAAFARYLQPLRQAEWVVYAKPPFAGPNQVLDYLGRYAHRGAVTPNRINRVDVFRMIKRRVRQAELGVVANCHTFRATGITAYLLNGGTVENAQAIAAHESPRTTKLYDRTADEISLDEIERIVI